MGVTYKAVHVDLHCPVTLKVIRERYLGDGSARLRFLREARAAASVRHPNVASVFHLGRTGQNYFYAMEFVEGETLENVIKRSGRLEVKLALEIAKQAAGGLAAVHKQKLVHRDIKPSNIMVSEVSSHLAHDVRQGAHARKVMASYQNWFGEGPELSVLLLLGLFDRPTDEKALGAC
jgi:serine/threonine protein kinase